MPFKIVRDDITKIKADAIVNTANPEPGYAGGTDRAIYEAAGAGELLEERRKIGQLTAGQAAITPAFALDAKYIIHTVGPQWMGGTHGESDLVRECYMRSCQLAAEYECESIAFPLISSGINGYPKGEAIQAAVTAISRFLIDHEMMVYLVVFDQQSFALSGRLYQGIDSYIDEHYVEHKRKTEYLEDQCNRMIPREVRQSEDRAPLIMPNDQRTVMSSPMVPKKRSLDEVMAQLGETFQERLLRLIDEKQMKDVEVYKKANLSRKLFSKIRCNVNYKPTKKTAVALAIALELSLDETKDLLGRAEMALSPSSKFDLIIEYFIENQVYDVYTINVALFQHKQPILGE